MHMQNIIHHTPLSVNGSCCRALVLCNSVEISFVHIVVFLLKADHFVGFQSNKPLDECRCGCWFMPRSKALGDAWKSEAKDLGPGTKASTSSQDVMGIQGLWSNILKGLDVEIDRSLQGKYNKHLQAFVWYQGQETGSFGVFESRQRHTKRLKTRFYFGKSQSWWFRTLSFGDDLFDFNTSNDQLCFCTIILRIAIWQRATISLVTK